MTLPSVPTAPDTPVAQCPTCGGRGWHTAGGNDPSPCGRCEAGEAWYGGGEEDAPVLRPVLEGTIRLDVGTVPAIWVQLPAEFERERGRFEVERREGLRADVFGIRFAAGTCWVAVPSSVAGEARRAGKLAVFTQPPLDVEDPGEAPYFTIDFYG